MKVFVFGMHEKRRFKSRRFQIHPIALNNYIWKNVCLMMMIKLSKQLLPAWLLSLNNSCNLKKSNLFQIQTQQMCRILLKLLLLELEAFLPNEIRFELCGSMTMRNLDRKATQTAQISITHKLVESYTLTCFWSSLIGCNRCTFAALFVSGFCESIRINLNKNIFFFTSIASHHC